MSRRLQTEQLNWIAEQKRAINTKEIQLKTEADLLDADFRRCREREKNVTDRERKADNESVQLAIEWKKIQWHIERHLNA